MCELKRDLIFMSASMCAIVIIIWSIAAPSQIFIAKSAVLECDSSRKDVIVCVHPADKNVQEEIADISERVFALAPQDKKVIVIEAMTSTSVLHIDHKELTHDQIYDMDNAITSALVGNENSNQMRSALYDDLISQKAASWTGCRTDEQNNESSGVISAVRTALRLRLGLPAQSDMINEATGKEFIDEDSIWLAKLSEKDFRNWYIQHRNTIKNCTITSIK